MQVARKEHVAGLTPEVAESIAAQSDRNLRKALLMFEAAAVQGQVQTGQIAKADWEQAVQHVATMVLEEQSPQRYLFH